MEQFFVVGARFEGVAEGVAVVEDRPQAGFFAFVLLDDVGLQPAAALRRYTSGRRHRGC